MAAMAVMDGRGVGSVDFVLGAGDAAHPMSMAQRNSAEIFLKKYMNSNIDRIRLYGYGCRP